MALTLWELWGHFESFILDRNMHFVVSNIVRPLTCDRQVSFVSLWGARQAGVSKRCALQTLQEPVHDCILRRIKIYKEQY